jgi:hypothetical protein
VAQEERPFLAAPTFMFDLAIHVTISIFDRRGGCEFETAELILRGGIAAYLSDYMSTKQEKNGTGNCS